MADFERKLTMLAERGTHVGPEEMIERVEARLAEDPLVVVTKQRKGWGMSVQTDEKQERRQSSPARGLAWAATAFVVVAGIAIAFLAFGEDPSDDVVQPAPTTTIVTPTTAPQGGETAMAPDQMVELVESGMQALYSGDFDTASGLFDFASGSRGLSAGDWENMAAYFERMNAVVSTDCELPRAGSAVVSCLIHYNDDLVRIVHGDEVESEEDTPVRIEDGRITSYQPVGPDSTLWSMGIYLAEIGSLDGFEGCMRTQLLTLQCAEIQQQHLDDYETWHSSFDATEIVATGLNAWFEGDCVLAITLFAGPMTDRLEDCMYEGTLPEVMDYERAIGADVEVASCDFVAAEEKATCTVTYTSLLHGAVGADPAEMIIEFLVTPVEKALWFYQSEFYRTADRYPHDAALDESFQTYADEQGFGNDHAALCRAPFYDAECARLRLENVDDWAVWHQANNA